MSTSCFELPARRSAKAAPARIAADEEHLGILRARLEHEIAATERHLDRALRDRTGDAQGRVEREAGVDHFRRRLRQLRGVRLEAVLGRMTPADGSAARYIGRLGLSGEDGRPLLLDWRSEAAEPFFAATRSDPKGLSSRRRYRWEGGLIRDYWDERLDGRPAGEDESPDEESALLASLGEARTGRMSSVLTTLAADQHAIIRDQAKGTLVVEGGPGTGKTVVALHRAAYLLHAVPHLRSGGGILFVGPHHPFLRFVADVLPGLGEEGVRTCTLADMVPEGVQAAPETRAEVAALKGSRALLESIEPAVALYEEPPVEPYELDTGWWSVVIEGEDWAEAFAAVEGAAPHNLARDILWEELAEIVGAKLAMHLEDPPDLSEVRRALDQDPELVRLVHRSWPLLEAADLVADLYEVPAYLRRCAPALTPQQVGLLQREDPRAWTVADLPLLDAARHRLGDPGTEARERRRAAQQRELVEEVELALEDLVAADGSEMQEMSMLRGQDMRAALADRAEVEIPPADTLAGPFSHIVVDEAQELDDAQWAMILRRCPSRSLTLVGDRAQATDGFTGSWQERLDRVGLSSVRSAGLSLNYRTPREIMEQAEPVIRAAVPGAAVPTSVRSSGIPVRHARPGDLEEVVSTWLARNAQGMVAVIGADEEAAAAARVSARHRRERVQVLTPALAKGLEADLVVLMAPGELPPPEHYVAMTRATRELVLLDR